MNIKKLFARASLKNLDEDLAFLAENGLFPEVYLPGENLDSLTTSDLDSLAKLKDSGGEISLHAPFMDLSPGGLDPKILEITKLRFSQVRDVVSAIGPVHVIFHPGYDRWRFGWNFDLWLTNCVPIWREIVQWAEKTDTNVLMENVFDVRPDHLLELNEHLDNRLKFCFDTGHFLLFSEVPLEDWLTSFGENLAELHLHDNRGDIDSHLPLGEGIFDFHSLFLFLNAHNRSPLIVIEHHSRAETLRSLANLPGIYEAALL